MAERRMFAKTIIDSDAFLDMPVTARLLYYDLAMRADDDGFVNSPRKIMRVVGASADDLTILAARKFIIPFDVGVVVIKHWRIHNYIRKDMYHETKYKEQKELLEVDENGAYRLPCNEDVTLLLHPRDENVTNPSTQVRLGKDRLGKDRLNPPNPPKGETVSDLISAFSVDEEVQQALKDFAEMRRSIKKPMTPRAMKGVLNKLKQLSQRPDIQVKILEQSIEHDWQTVYELKEKEAETKTQQGVDMIAQWLAGKEDDGQG